jgi:hypothetical protein
MACPCTIKS